MDYKELADNVHQTYLKLKDNSNTIFRNSPEYRAVKDGYEKIDTYMQNIVKVEKTGKEIGPELIKSIMFELEQVRDLSNAYLDAKDKEMDKAKNGKLAPDTNRRYGHVSDVLEKTNEFISELNTMKENLEKEENKDIQTLAEDSVSSLKAIENAAMTAEKGMGSKEYDKAWDQAIIVAEITNAMKQKVNENKELTTADHVYLLAQAKYAKTKIQDYIMLHKDEESMSKRRVARMNAMTAELDTLNSIIKTCEKEVENYWNREPKTVGEIKTLADETMTKLQQANNRVTFGSSEFKNAYKQAKLFKNLLDKMNESPDYKPSAKDIAELEANIRTCDKCMNDYLSKHKDDTEIKEGTRERIDAMLALGLLAGETKKTLDGIKAEMRKEKEFKNTDLNDKYYSIDGEMRQWKNSSLFGSDEYSKAKDAYMDVHTLVQKVERNKNIKPGDANLKQAIKGLQDAKELIEKYIDKKNKEKAKKKNHKLDDLSTRRLGIMERALESVNNRLSYYENKFGKENVNKTDIAKAKLENRKTETNKVKETYQKEIDSKEGVQKIITKAAYNAVITLEELSKKRSLTKTDIEMANRALITLTDKSAADQLEKKTDEVYTLNGKPVNSKQYAAMVAQRVSKSDSAGLELTPEKCGIYAANPHLCKANVRSYDKGKQIHLTTKVNDEIKKSSQKLGEEIKKGNADNIKKPEPAVKK